MTDLSFCIIGAQKSATTTIFKWLNEHPELALPASKEAPFFSKEALFVQGWDACFQQNFQKTSDGVQYGTASPQYFGIKKVPVRMYELFPKIKLIMVLRNPVDRAYSHYQMEVRADRETRSFSEAINDLLQPEQIELSRNADLGVVKAYVSFGEYGFLTQRWLNYFDLDQMLILTMDEIEKTPKDAFDKICTFLNIDSSLTPSSLGKKFHQGGTETWLPTTAKLKKFRLFKVLKSLVPRRIYSRFAFWYKIHNVKTNKPPAPMTDDIRAKLENHYAKDAVLFRQVTGVSLPWL